MNFDFITKSLLFKITLILLISAVTLSAVIEERNNSKFFESHTELNDSENHDFEDNDEEIKNSTITYSIHRDNKIRLFRPKSRTESLTGQYKKSYIRGPPTS